VRYLTIVRHAKAEKGAPGQSDFARTLSDRGRRQCEQLRTWASDESELARFGPAVALVSSSARTRETFELGLAGTPLVSDVVFSELIYNGRRDVSGEDLLVDIAAIDPVTTSLLVVGHNPTVLELVWALTKKLPASLRDGFPTGGAFVLALPEDQQIGLAHYEFLTAYVPD
jgi:phosphohistidine phosphatase